MGYLEEQLARMEESERKHQELVEANHIAMERREKIKAAYPEAFEDIGSTFNLDKSYADDITKIVSINEGYMSMAELDTMRQSNEIDNALSDVYAKAVKDRDYLSNNKEECLTALVDVAKSHMGTAFPVVANTIAEIVIDKEVKLQNLEQVMDACRISLPNIEQSQEVKTATWRDAPKPLEKEDIQIGDVTVTKNYEGVEGRWNVGFRTPMDEDMRENVFTAESVKDLGAKLLDYADSFDVDEHVSLWLKCDDDLKRNPPDWDGELANASDFIENAEKLIKSFSENDIKAWDSPEEKFTDLAAENGVSAECYDGMTEISDGNGYRISLDSVPGGEGFYSELENAVNDLDYGQLVLDKFNAEDHQNGAPGIIELVDDAKWIKDAFEKTGRELYTDGINIGANEKEVDMETSYPNPVNAKDIEVDMETAYPGPNRGYDVIAVEKDVSTGLWDAEIKGKFEYAGFYYSDAYGKMAAYDDLKQGLMLHYNAEIPPYEEITAISDDRRVSVGDKVTIIVPQNLEELYNGIFDTFEMSADTGKALDRYISGLKSQGIDSKALEAAREGKGTYDLIEELQKTYDTYVEREERKECEKDKAEQEHGKKDKDKGMDI